MCVCVCARVSVYLDVSSPKLNNFDSIQNYSASVKRCGARILTDYNQSNCTYTFREAPAYVPFAQNFVMQHEHLGYRRCDCTVNTKNIEIYKTY